MGTNRVGELRVTLVLVYKLERGVAILIFSVSHKVLQSVFSRLFNNQATVQNLRNSFKVGIWVSKIQIQINKVRQDGTCKPSSSANSLKHENLAVCPTDDSSETS